MSGVCQQTDPVGCENGQIVYLMGKGKVGAQHHPISRSRSPPAIEEPPPFTLPIAVPSEVGLKRERERERSLRPRGTGRDGFFKRKEF